MKGSRPHDEFDTMPKGRIAASMVLTVYIGSAITYGMIKIGNS
jgi:hypothetical protein